jgi:hypothetical protein
MFAYPLFTSIVTLIIYGYDVNTCIKLQYSNATLKCGILIAQRPNIRTRIVWSVDHRVCSIWYHSPSSAARNAPVLLRGFVVVLFPLPRPLDVPRVELRENDAFRLKPRPPLLDPVETQGSGQSGQAKISTRRVTSPNQRSPLL